MVQLMNSRKTQFESDTSTQCKVQVKLEIEDYLEDQHGPLNKRSKFSSSSSSSSSTQQEQQQWRSGGASSSIPPSEYNLLEEPSPLGLRLRKSPSLLELIQMRLSQGNGSSLGGIGANGNPDIVKKEKEKELKQSAPSSAADKLKASNFPASLLKIGSWEYLSRYEGDLVAKCYYAKHKLVWEVLDGGLKSKIEIQWSDITALKANYSDDGPATLDIVLSRQPLFFRETNPQPRKHTLWQATSDFTNGQASLYRRHFLQCPKGLLNKHFEKLIQCDARLNLLSLQPALVLESPYFEPKGSVFSESVEAKCEVFDKVNRDHTSTFYGLGDAPSPSASFSSSSKSELRDQLVDRAQEHSSRENPSPSSVMDLRATEDSRSIELGKLKGLNRWDQFKVPGLNKSMSMSDLVNHIGNCISEQMTSSNPVVRDEGLQNKDLLEGITQHLLGDNQLASTSDEKVLMSRVNSLCCLLQKDPAPAPSFQISSDGFDDHAEDQVESAPEYKVNGDSVDRERESYDAPGCKQEPGMSRKDSVQDLMLHLPRIASLPQFLFNITGDGENQAR